MIEAGVVLRVVTEIESQKLQDLFGSGVDLDTRVRDRRFPSAYGSTWATEQFPKVCYLIVGKQTDFLQRVNALLFNDG